MDKFEFIKKYQETCTTIGLSLHQALVSAGGACLMLGLRDKSSDIDLDIPAEVFDALANTGEFEVRGALDPEDRLIVWDEHVDLHRMSGPRDWINVEGVALYTLDALIEQKVRMSTHPRRKAHKVAQDIQDVKVLKELKAELTPGAPMHRAEEWKVGPKVHWLIVDKESLIVTAKEMIGVDNHITDTHFFEVLEGIMRKHPLPVYRGARTDFKDSSDSDLPEHVASAMETMRKRQSLILDLPRLIGLWPEVATDLLVVSVCDAVFGHVPRVPQAFHFLADTICIMQKDAVAPIRARDNSNFFDKITEVIPVNSEILNIIR